MCIYVVKGCDSRPIYFFYLFSPIISHMTRSPVDCKSFWIAGDSGRYRGKLVSSCVYRVLWCALRLSPQPETLVFKSHLNDCLVILCWSARNRSRNLETTHLVFYLLCYACWLGHYRPWKKFMKILRKMFFHVDFIPRNVNFSARIT